MGKNVVIFSDGTGQHGGIFVDEYRSNIYKLYRATRCGPDSQVDPAKQVAFYDPGIGTLSPQKNGLWQRIYNLVSQALGLGLTGNIIDCYAALVRLWRPGDDIYLFGFSRGAYTVRCLAAVIALCGVPTRLPGGREMRYDNKTTKRIAKHAVRRVYQHTSSWDLNKRVSKSKLDRWKELLNQRAELGRRFREAHGSAAGDKANVYPHFIGVFDTVASVANPSALIWLIFVAVVAVAVMALALWPLLAWTFPGYGGWPYIAAGIVGAAVFIGLGAVVTNMAKRFRSEIGLPRRYKLRFFHLTEWRLAFYDTQLNSNVHYARHALSIDEARRSFSRLSWGNPKDDERDTGIDAQGQPNPTWLIQLWFAGNHADIGGSYAEDESRLSDIAARWMLDSACRVGLAHDPALLRLHSDPAGPQHDETKSSRVFRWMPKKLRSLRKDATLHPSVIERFKAGKVLQYDRLADYRPENLRDHKDVGPFYEPHSPPA